MTTTNFIRRRNYNPRENRPFKTFNLTDTAILSKEMQKMKDKARSSKAPCSARISSSPKQRKSPSSVPSLDAPPPCCQPRLAPSTHQYRGVTTRYRSRDRSSSDLDAEVIELQHTTKSALDASWEEIEYLKTKAKACREKVSDMEEELSRLQQERERRVSREKVSDTLCRQRQDGVAERVPLPPRSSSDPDLYRVRMVPRKCKSASQLTSAPFHSSWSRQQLQNRRQVSLLNGVLGGLGKLGIIRSSARRMRDLRVKLNYLRQNHSNEMLRLRHQLQNKNLTEAAVKKDTERIRRFVLRQQRECLSQKAVGYEAKVERGERRAELMMKLVEIVEKVSTKESELYQRQHVAVRDRAENGLHGRRRHAV